VLKIFKRKNIEIFRGRAFAYRNKIEGKEVLGNPASIIVCEKNFPIQEEMSNIAIKEKQPISVFIKKRDNEKNGFDVKYFLPNGFETALCGHGTLFATKILSERFKTKDKFKFYFNKNLLNLNKKVKYLDYLSSYIDNNGLISLNLPKYNLEYLSLKNLNTNLQKIVQILDIKIKDINIIAKCIEIKDYIIELNNLEILRKLNPDFRKMEKFCLDLGCRNIVITSRSNIQNFDYETRVFSPHCSLDEDIVCGSTNCGLAPFWLEKLSKNNLKNLYSYHFNKEKIGGVQFINVNEDNLDLSGYVSE
jgi:PhzF family phenazine biosynthesis protein